MYAIIRTGGRQFRVEPGRTIQLPSLPAEAGDTVTFNEVLLGATDDGVKVGAPLVAGAAVTAQVVRHGRGEKITIFKFKRRKNYRRKQGHRQNFTEVLIGDINLG